MNDEYLQTLWQLVEEAHFGSSELWVHSVGTTSAGFDLCVGSDLQKRRHLLIPLPVDQLSAPHFKSSGLVVKTRMLMRDQTEKLYLDLICISPGLNAVFSHLILDVLQQMQPEEPKAAEICYSVLEDWKELFGLGSSQMSKEQIVGLTGELIVLEVLTASNPAALSYWDGPAGGIHDFRCERRALEVKSTTRRHGRIFSISGHLQLDPPSGGDLHFVAIKLEQNPGGSVTIPGLIEKIRKNGVRPNLLTQKLSETGYVAGTNELAETARFDLSEFSIYCVNEQFPKIIASSFVSGNTPSGVLKITYEIDLSGDSPRALDSVQKNRFLSDFSTGGSL